MTQYFSSTKIKELSKGNLYLAKQPVQMKNKSISDEDMLREFVPNKYIFK